MKTNRIIAILLFVLLFSTVSYGATSTIDTSQINKGIVGVSYAASNNKKIKVMISKGTEKYTYDLKSQGQFPLQMGNGDYSISVLENVDGNKYKVLETKKVSLQNTDQSVGFLQSTEMVNWNDSMKAVKLAKELTKNAKTDKEKATLIYNYVSKNIQYDYNKANGVAAGYIPSIDNVLDTSLGICYDYSVLYGAMLRSVGVPTKMLMGHKSDVEEYHAWNQVYLSESNEWVTIDTTYDAASVQSNIAIPMIKNSNEYTITKTY